MIYLKIPKVPTAKFPSKKVPQEDEYQNYLLKKKFFINQFSLFTNCLKFCHFFGHLPLI